MRVDHRSRPFAPPRLSWLELAIATVAFVTYFLDWHVWHQTTAMDLGPVFCAMSPDCHPGPPVPVHDTGVVQTCSGFTHDEYAVVLVLLAVLLSSSAVAARRWRPRVAIVQLLVALATLGAGVWLTLLAHMFDRVEHSWPERVFPASLGVVVLVVLCRLGAEVRHRLAKSD